MLRWNFSHDLPFRPTRRTAPSRRALFSRLAVPAVVHRNTDAHRYWKDRHLHLGSGRGCAAIPRATVVVRACAGVAGQNRDDPGPLLPVVLPGRHVLSIAQPGRELAESAAVRRADQLRALSAVYPASQAL